MTNLTFHMLSPYVIGKHGKHWPEYGGADRVFLHGIFRQESKILGISPSSACKYINGSANFPKKLRRMYIAPGGDALLYTNITNMISACPCVSHLVDMQAEIYKVILNCPLPQETYTQLASLYISEQPTTDNIARFLAAVLHYAILAS